MNPLAVIIPSRIAANLVACMRAVWENEWNADIIVVDDGLAPSVEEKEALQQFDHKNRPRWISGDKPFVFSRNINKGIAKAGNADIVILNDDALLKTPGGFSLMQRAASENPEYGLVAATTNNAGNRNQFPQGIGLREDSRMVCFICVLVPRRTIENVGLLDERFVHYGCEDDDYCLRIRNASLKIGIHDGCFVDHLSLHSSYRGPAGAGGNYLPNLEIFKQKWGMDNWGRPA